MIDIHCHLLYGVDDGAESLAEASKMMKIAYKAGVTDIIVTPHCNVPDSYGNYWNNEMDERFSSLCSLAKEYEIPINLHKGQEIFCTKRVPVLLQSGSLIPLASSKYILTEFGFNESPIFVFERTEELLKLGYKVIIAHPERYDFVIEDTEAAEILKNMGALLQINKGSILGSFGHKIKDTANALLRMKLADIVASDAHSAARRTTDLLPAYEYVCEYYSKEYADKLITENPMKITE